MANVELKVKSRNIVGKQVEDLRNEGYMPAVIYGPEFDSVNIMAPKNIFEKLYNEAGNSKIITIYIDDDKTPIEALIQDVSYDPVTNFIVHADFYKFKAGQLMDATIELNFINEAKPVKEKGAILLKSKDEIDVRCLPRDLISEIDVDLSRIQTLDDVIKIKDLVVPENIQVKHDPEEIIALTRVQAEEAEAAPAAEPAAEEKSKEEKAGEKKEENTNKKEK